MEASGIVRRVDDLGRIVIPKEIRSNLRIKSGECLEIYTVDDKILLNFWILCNRCLKTKITFNHNDIN